MTVNILIIRPNEQPERMTIDPTLETLQHLVDGYIERTPLGNDVAAYVNEEGRLRHLPANRRIAATAQKPAQWTTLYGTIILIAHDPETDDYTDLTDEQAEQALNLLAPTPTAR